MVQNYDTKYHHQHHSLLDIYIQPDNLFACSKSRTKKNCILTTTHNNDVSIYHDEHKFFTQPICQSIHHALNFQFIITWIHWCHIDIYIIVNINTVLSVFVDVVRLSFPGNRRTTSTNTNSTVLMFTMIYTSNKHQWQRYL